MEFEKTQVVSSVVEAVGHNRENKVLRVWLKGGRIYDYFGVPATRYKSFISASSKGIYYNTVIKKLYKEYEEAMEYTSY